MNEATNVEITQKMIALFDEHREHFGISEEPALEDQCDFEEKFAKLICEFKGHDMIPDQCGKPEHDYCVTCGVRQEDIDAA